jgi:hypothetical protein
VRAEHEGAAQRAHAVLINAGLFARLARHVVPRRFVLLERAAFDERRDLVQQRLVAGHPDVAVHGQRQP